MKKILFSVLFSLGLVNLCFAVPSNSISIPNSFSPNTIISSSQTNANNVEFQTKFNAHTHTDLTQTGTITTGTWQGSVIDETYGGTGNAYGIGLPSGAVFFMVSGSCPSGTTDVSSTYSNKFVRINATAASTGGADTDSITLTTTELPAHTHTTTLSLRHGASGANPAAAYFSEGDTENGYGTETATTSSTGSGTAFSVDTVPAYVTMKACQVD